MRRVTAAQQSLPGGAVSLRNEVIVAAGIGVVAALLPFHRGLGFPFALDDYTFLYKAAGFDPAPFEVRRWLTVTGYYTLALRLFGTNLLPWHLVAFALHAGNTAWVHALARRFDASRNAAWIASGLFASSPLAFTVLYWVAGIQELSSTFFLLASVWAASRTGAKRWVALPLFVAALLCKESVMAAPLALPLLLGKPARRLAIAELVCSIGLFLASGLHHRLDSDVKLPYATSFGATLFVNLATLLMWFASPWRAYPDRLAGPQTSLVLPAVALLGAIFVVVRMRRWSTRPVLCAGVWFVALVLPVLPLKQHTYAYYAYAAQIGWLVLAGVALELAAQRWGRRGAQWVLAAGATVVALSIVFAARNARTHETLMLQANSVVPYDAVVRYGRAATALVAAARSARAEQPTLQQIAFFALPSELGSGSLTPGKVEPGMVRVRKVPIREVLSGGRLIPLHVPGLVGVWVDSLSPSVEGPETALYFASGFNTVTRITDLAEAYYVQAQGRLVLGPRSAAVRDLERALTFNYDHAPARVLLAGLRLEAGRESEARALLDGMRAEEVPEEIQPLLAELRKVLKE
ncbi:MAG TPA: tetratricopeptide repeat protein [Candidatus Krumholzibacteria bacterium]|nr:tetratricopeptide repeat protein [Candidatus Krumholzibacteria bacterium]